jgi:hypothetical protein
LTGGFAFFFGTWVRTGGFPGFGFGAVAVGVVVLGAVVVGFAVVVVTGAVVVAGAAGGDGCFGARFAAA